MTGESQTKNVCANFSLRTQNGRKFFALCTHTARCDLSSFLSFSFFFSSLLLHKTLESQTNQGRDSRVCPFHSRFTFERALIGRKQMDYSVTQRIHWSEASKVQLRRDRNGHNSEFRPRKLTGIYFFPYNSHGGCSVNFLCRIFLRATMSYPPRLHGSL